MKPAPKHIRTTTYWPSPETKDVFDTACDSLKLSASDLIQVALREFLAAHPEIGVSLPQDMPDRRARRGHRKTESE